MEINNSMTLRQYINSLDTTVLTQGRAKRFFNAAEYVQKKNNGLLNKKLSEIPTYQWDRFSTFFDLCSEIESKSYIAKHYPEHKEEIVKIKKNYDLYYILLFNWLEVNEKAMDWELLCERVKITTRKWV